MYGIADPFAILACGSVVRPEAIVSSGKVNWLIDGVDSERRVELTVDHGLVNPRTGRGRKPSIGSNQSSRLTSRLALYRRRMRAVFIV